jgi:hypothetical protein
LAVRSFDRPGEPAAPPAGRRVALTAGTLPSGGGPCPAQRPLGVGRKPLRIGGRSVATKKPAEYATAVALLQDLDEISTRAGRDRQFRDRLQGLREQHERRPAFLRRLDEQGLPR